MKYQPGESGNPNGRPKGTSPRQQLFNSLISSRQEELVNKAIEMAMNGNEAMMKTLLDRLLPAKPTSEPINLELPKVDWNDIRAPTILREFIFEKISNGELTSDQGSELSSFLCSHQKHAELPQKIIDMLEELNSKVQNLKIASDSSAFNETIDNSSLA